MDQKRRGPGRPRKAEAFDGPVILTVGKNREKLEIELTTATRRELDEYLTWVEQCEPTVTPGELWFATFEYAITALFQSDKKWRERQRQPRGTKDPLGDAPSVTLAAKQPAGPGVGSEALSRPGTAAPSLPLPSGRDQKATV